MIKSAKGSNLDDDLDDEETFLLKKETPSPIHKGVRVWIENKCIKILLFEKKSSIMCALFELHVCGIEDFVLSFFRGIEGKGGRKEQ